MNYHFRVLIGGRFHTTTDRQWKLQLRKMELSDACGWQWELWASHDSSCWIISRSAQ